jgi:hypothetical protein
MVGMVEVLIVLKIDIRCSGRSDAYEPAGAGKSVLQAGLAARSFVPVGERVGIYIYIYIYIYIPPTNLEESERRTSEHPPRRETTENQLRYR